ncbi:MAG: glycosyltransferase [Muribaculaceae bacterium]
MKLVLLFGLFPNETRDVIIGRSKGVIQYAADALQWAIVKGLNANNIEYDIINLPYIGAYPGGYDTLYTQRSKFSTNNITPELEGENVPFCNLKGYKHISRYLGAKRALKRKIKELKSSNINILIYSVNTSFIKAAIDLKKQYNDIKITIIVPDLPQYMGGSMSFPINYIKKYNQQLLYNYYTYIDKFVLLSKYMVDALPVGDKPVAVMEGIYDSENIPFSEKKINNNQKIIFYGGTLAKRYGIINLVNAFMTLTNKQYHLIICGEGDAKEEIIEASLKDSRIKYKGQLDRNEILNFQRNSNLLVNPRTPEGKFTKYSFPSKTMEYLASGTPVLLYKLDGIPDEYYNYCFSLEKFEGIYQLSNKMDEILKMDDVKLNEIGKYAQAFILNNKNPKAQVKKIIDLINNN